VEKKGFFESTAAFAGDLVIAGCGDGFVYAWKAATGDEVWKFETEGEIHAGVNTWKDEAGNVRILIGSYDNDLYCLDAAKGTKIWAFETANYVNGASAIFDNQVVFGGCDGMLYVLDVKTGNEIKKIDVGNYIGNNIAASGGNAYLAHYGNKIEAYSFSTGAKLWEYNDRDFPYYAAPAVNDQWVVDGGRDKRLHALDRATGQQKWDFRTRGDVDSSPVITADGHVIFGSNDGFLYAVKLSDGSETWRYEIGSPIKSAPAISHGCILIGADDGAVYCFKSATVHAPK
jgi:outer membrane protein assembly factor BamB